MCRLTVSGLRVILCRPLGMVNISIVRIQRQPEPDAPWQVGIREEMPPKSDQIRIAISNSSLRYAAKLVRWPWTPALIYSSTTALFRSFSD